MKSEGGAYEMKSLDAGRTGVNDKHTIPFRIADNLKNVGMTTNEYVRSVTVDQFSGTRVISTGVTSDMYHKYFETLTFEKSMERMNEAQIMVIAIAGHAHKRLEISNFLRQSHSSSEVAGMPYLIHRLEKFAEPGIKHTMSI